MSNDTRFPVWHFLVGIPLVVTAIVVADRNFLLFHGLAEFASIAVAWAILMMAWPSRRFSTNDYLLFLGIAYFGVGVLDLVHTLSYKGMGVFPGISANEPTQLWIAARYLEACTLFTAPTFLKRRLPLGAVTVLIGVVTGGAIFLVMGTDLFPDCFIEGVGLTPFKRWSEYVIVLIVGGALWRLVRHRESSDRRLFRLVAASLVLTILAELAFTAYVSVDGTANMVGHLLKLLSFYLIYLGVIHTGLTRPYGVLFSDLARATEELRVSNEDLTRQIAKRVETEDGLRSINGEMRGQLEDLNAQKRDLVLRVAESVLRKADNTQQTVRANRAVVELQEENEILRTQLSEYLLMFEQAQSGIDTMLAGYGNVEGGEGR